MKYGIYEKKSHGERRHQGPVDQDFYDLRDYLNKAPIGMNILAPDGAILWANKAEMDMLGYAPEEYISRNIADFHLDRDKIGEILDSFGHGEDLRNYDAVLKCKDGSLKHVLISMDEQWEGDTFIHARCFTVDNSAAKEMDLARAHLAAIVESSDDIIVSKDLDGIITSWNASAERIFGYSAAEAIGQNIKLIIPPDRYDEEAEIIRTLKAGNRMDHFETARLAKDGHLIDLSLTVSPIKDSHGAVIGISKVARDITERKKTESQLIEERETLETLSRLAPAFVSNLDLQSLVQLATDEATRLTRAQFGAFFYNFYNEEGKAFRLYTLSGAPRESFSHLGMPRATSIFGPIFRGEGTILLDDVTADPRYGHNKPHYGIPEGHLPVKSFLAVPVVSRSGEAIGGLFFGHARTGVFTARDARLVEGIAAQAAIGIENARLYEQVKQGLERAQEASKAKSEFLATMSHEIRTPMNAIIGLSSILATSGLNPKQSQFVKTLQASADSLLTLINDLLDISKIEARTVELESVPFSVEQILQQVISMMALRAEEKGLVFSANCQSVHNRMFIGDPTRLRQILSNLCSNALKFTENGSVSIETSCVPTDDPAVARVSISVRDTGIGIPQEKLDTIFQKFVQADSSINRKYGGTGLGLAITKTLAEMMGGTISVESDLGNGSVFAVSLPFRLAPGALPLEDGHEQPLAHDRPPMQANKKTVLLVEDYEPNILVASTFLEDLGYGYEVARNGVEAIEKVKAGHYSFTLMDVQMPGMNGFESTQLIREYERAEGLKRMPIIGLTAHALAGDKERCLSAGMDAYLPKPFNLDDLKRTLEKLDKVSN